MYCFVVAFDSHMAKLIVAQNRGSSKARGTKLKRRMSLPIDAKIGSVAPTMWRLSV